MSAWGLVFILAIAAVGVWLGPLALALIYRAIYRRAVSSPAIVDVAGNFPYGVTLKENWTSIRTEYLKARQETKHIRSLSSIDPYQQRLTHYGGVTWDVCVLKLYGRQVQAVTDSFPITNELLNGEQRIVTAMFSVLRPGKHIPPHRGLFKGLLRYHLCIVGPNDQKCFLEIDGKKYTWFEGEYLLFDDTFLHSATNEASSERVVLFLDIVRDDVPAVFKRIDRFWFFLAHHSFRARSAVARAARPKPNGGRSQSR